MTLYAESSAVLAWLLAEEAGEHVREALASAAMIFASDLTLIECDRVLIRAENARHISEADVRDRRAFLNAAAAHWQLLRVNGDVVERARRPFPKEPIRTLDAMHLASALVARAALPGVHMLSLDGTVRAVARELGFGLVPA